MRETKTGNQGEQFGRRSFDVSVPAVKESAAERDPHRIDAGDLGQTESDPSAKGSR